MLWGSSIASLAWIAGMRPSRRAKYNTTLVGIQKCSSLVAPGTGGVASGNQTPAFHAQRRTICLKPFRTKTAVPFRGQTSQILICPFNGTTVVLKRDITLLETSEEALKRHNLSITADGRMILPVQQYCWVFRLVVDGRYHPRFQPLLLVAMWACRRG